LGGGGQDSFHGRISYFTYKSGGATKKENSVQRRKDQLLPDFRRETRHFSREEYTL